MKKKISFRMTQNFLIGNVIQIWVIRVVNTLTSIAKERINNTFQAPWGGKQKDFFIAEPLQLLCS
jgi:hypothetical protein